MSSVGMDPVTFEFIDPIWVWINQAAEAGASHKLWFKCHDARNAAGERMYGGGVQYGDAMRQAVCACRPGEVPALISLHFDKGLMLGAYTQPLTEKRDTHSRYTLESVSRECVCLESVCLESVSRECVSSVCLSRECVCLESVSRE